MIKVKKGLDLPLLGFPKMTIENAKPVTKVALLGPDYVGMKPTMNVQVGDEVKIGQVLFEDKKVPGVLFTSPAAGKVLEINRGDKRAFQSIVVEISSDEGAIEFDKHQSLDSIRPEKIRSQLIESGLWTAFRTRPYSKSPGVDTLPNSIFINAMDTNPLAADPEVILRQYNEDFSNGVKILSKIGQKNTFVCVSKKEKLSLNDLKDVKVVEFNGPHPAGNSGTHMHFLDPVSLKKTNWSINYQDVIAVGKLFTTGQLWTERIVAVAGPKAVSPRLLKTRLGAKISEVINGEVKAGDNRIISGSPLNGHLASGPFDYLGRFNNQISILEEGREREFLGWQMPGLDKFSVQRTFVSKLFPGKMFNLTTDRNGSFRAIVPVGSYEKVMPLDILPTQLLRALITNDTDLSQLLGALELDEEDLSLCTFVDPGKIDYGPILRKILTIIEKEG